MFQVIHVTNTDCSLSCWFSEDELLSVFDFVSERSVKALCQEEGSFPVLIGWRNTSWKNPNSNLKISGKIYGACLVSRNMKSNNSVIHFRLQRQSFNFMRQEKYMSLFCLFSLIFTLAWKLGNQSEIFIWKLLCAYSGPSSYLIKIRFFFLLEITFSAKILLKIFGL